jgi:uncharacterized membrane protein
VLSRFDLWPAALTIGALAAFVADRRRLGFAVLGLAVAAKVYAAVVFPLAVVYVWRRAGRRAGLLAAATGAAVVVACFVPFLVLAPHGVWSSLSGQARRPSLLVGVALVAIWVAFGRGSRHARPCSRRGVRLLRVA